MGLLNKLKEKLSKTKQSIVEKIEGIVPAGGKIDEKTIEEVEEILISSDIGVKATEEITDILRKKFKENSIRNVTDIKTLLKKELIELLQNNTSLNLKASPSVILVVGVNGVGKTTTIGKLGYKFSSEGKSVVFAAADTFRAAAIEQLEVWALRVGADVIKHKSGSDPAAVAFDALEYAKSNHKDVVIIDTAGRLHTKVPLMEELRKINKVIKKSISDAPHETLLILDATTGQNALRQATFFNEAVGLTGVIVTKLDGTAKGGVVFAIKKEIGIPIKLIGIGEDFDDLKDFNPEEFVEALFD
ncbi:MAG TPA: signal recognition particle-docking protein FtsY [Thermodesulfovibrio thiophilus]|uniref:signal recognition particle-docking protein FtsY n=1 Tax=Thermodesulfovibrio thiophilus TaxID=340095 RepID=UPI00183E3048|nr:signal recognition particle-docking protein FtsY [Thermodesulfovibrio thiophilus]HHW20592.1 signal recognition particle-docking protein FtsY [Thermodesulfovibrio thiophilus]HOA83081.1 signal recognition particle-docking protein FtsY [Thermodesulfovibrio thiophilus]HQA03281.1 signal recognition particle-docking protein FtsY [Thermodesulfovibrio thiophilus]HQD36141.1 signal recognition particle-docking protein FtsY [Thermodesulfovibrio thiophilus]